MPLNTLPRHLPGTPPSARVFNRTADEVDALGLSLTVKRDVPADTIEGGLPANVDRIVQWHSAVSGTGTVAGGDAMWSPGQPQFVTIRRPGVYLMFVQLRFSLFYKPPDYEPQNWASSITPGSKRWSRILLNGTSLSTDCLAQTMRPAVNVGLGLTLQTLAFAPLQEGDTIWTGMRAAQFAPALDTDAGGTYLTVSRVGPAPWSADEPAGSART